jgi:biopolymer transport protein ExbD
MSAGGGGGEGDVELNIAPIVDCFTVLIAYMLVSMSYIQLSIFEAGVAANAPPDSAPAEPPPPDAKVPLSFSIEVSEANQLQLKLTGGKPEVNEVSTLEPVNGAPDTVTLSKKIGEMKTAHPDLAEANLSATNAIKYRTVIKVIQAIKSVLPKVFLASS